MRFANFDYYTVAVPTIQKPATLFHGIQFRGYYHAVIPHVNNASDSRLSQTKRVVQAVLRANKGVTHD